MTDQLTSHPGLSPRQQGFPAAGAREPSIDVDATFAAATAVFPGERPGTFTAHLDPRWTIGDKPNGGYMVALLGRATTLTLPTTDVLAASAHFLRAPSPGPVDIVVETRRAGRSISHVRARLIQDGTDCVEALFTHGALGTSDGHSWTGTTPPPTAAPLVDCVRLIPDPRQLSVPLLELVSVHLSPATMSWAQGNPTNRGELTGWLTLPGDASFDPLSLLFAVDSFPPATFDIEFSGWVPTYQLSVYVRALPAPGPVQILQRAQLIADGTVDESCYVWDQEGTLVAHSTQLAGVRMSGLA